MQPKAGLDEQYYEKLATGRAGHGFFSTEEPSWALEGRTNVFTVLRYKSMVGADLGMATSGSIFFAMSLKSAETTSDLQGNAMRKISSFSGETVVENCAR
jgi:hypothetical protein